MTAVARGHRQGDDVLRLLLVDAVVAVGADAALLQRGVEAVDVGPALDEQVVDLRRVLFHSKSVAGGLAVITAYLVWGELGDLFRSGAVEAPRAPRAVEQPLLANPKVRRRLISLLALAGATVLILLKAAKATLDA